MKKEHYTPPSVLKKIVVQLEREFLVGTKVSSNTSAKSAGQEINDYDFSNSSSIETGEIFNYRWGEEH